MRQPPGLVRGGLGRDDGGELASAVPTREGCGPGHDRARVREDRQRLVAGGIGRSRGPRARTAPRREG